MMSIPKKKSRYRIVPAKNEKFGTCWSLKDGELLIGMFISKQHAEKRKLQLEQAMVEDFLLRSTRNQPLKILED